MNPNRRTFLLATLAAPAVIAGAKVPITLKGVVEARGTMGPLHYKVEGAGPLLPDSPRFHLTSSVPVTNLASAKPEVILESPRGKITIKITEEISIKAKTVVPFTILGGTGAYARCSGTGRIKIELLERSGFNGTVRLTFLRPTPNPAIDKIPK